jgi:menaquinone-9 beta-reductase
MPEQYDIITIGGGLGSSALAKSMAERGYRVLLLERERQFKDRVRGEYMSPWGVSEARELGIYDPIRKACGIDVRYVDMGFGPRDLIATTPQQQPSFAFYHPEMQETVLAAAQDAGAEVRRGVNVTELKTGANPSVVVQPLSPQSKMHSEEINARLIVAADGRQSMARKWAGFNVQEDAKPFLFAGLSLADMSSSEQNAYLLFNPSLGMATAITPVGRGRFRTYVAYQETADYRLQGDEKVPLFIEEAIRAAPVGEFYGSAKPVGPLASFRCGHFWVDHPYKDGLVLIGDAAATSDPAFGQGLSTTVRDARVLRDELTATNDWDEAGHAYAAEHDRYSDVIHKVKNWFRQIFLEQSPEADARRAKALPPLAEDPHTRSRPPAQRTRPALR